MAKSKQDQRPHVSRRHKLRLSTEPESLAELVEAFKQKCLPTILDELEFYAQQPSLEEAIQVATCKGHSHLRPRWWDALDTAKSVLLRSSKLRGEFLSFEQLYAVIAEEVRFILGIGSLTEYDIAHRLGAYLSLEPKEVYLHSGSKEGAKILGIESKERKVGRQEFPVEVQQLEPQFIEDFLCICRQHLHRLQVSNPTAQPDGQRTDVRRPYG